MKNIINIILVFTVFICDAKSYKTHVSDYIPVSPVYILNGQTAQMQCIRGYLKSSLNSKKTIRIDYMTDFSKLEEAVVGMKIRNMYYSSLGDIIENTFLSLKDPIGLPNEEDLQDTNKYDYFIRGQLTSLEHNINKGGNVGLYTDMFSFAIDNSKELALLMMDFRLVNSQADVLKTTSLTQILKSIARGNDGTGEKKRRGVYIEWGRDRSDSVSLAIKMIINESIIIFLKKITGFSFSECQGYSRAESITLEPVEVRYSYYQNSKPRMRKLSSAFSNHPNIAKSFKCRNFRQECVFGFIGNPKRDPYILPHARLAFELSYTGGIIPKVKCEIIATGTIRCEAEGKGIYNSFDPRLFKRNLYKS